MTIRDDLKRLIAKEGPVATISVRLFNNQAYLVQVKRFEEDFMSVKVHNSWSRNIAYSAIAEWWDVTGSEAHPFKDIAPKEE